MLFTSCKDLLISIFILLHLYTLHIKGVSVENRIFTEKMFNTIEVMAFLRVDRLTVLKLMPTELNGFKIEREWRVFESDINNYIQNQIAKTANKK